MRISIDKLAEVEGEWLSIAQCATILECADESIRSYTKLQGDNQLASVKFATIKVHRKSLVEFINKRTTGNIEFYDPKE